MGAAWVGTEAGRAARDGLHLSVVGLASGRRWVEAEGDVGM